MGHTQICRTIAHIGCASRVNLALKPSCATNAKVHKCRLRMNPFKQLKESIHNNQVAFQGYCSGLRHTKCLPWLFTGLVAFRSASARVCGDGYPKKGTPRHSSTSACQYIQNATRCGMKPYLQHHCTIKILEGSYRLLSAQKLVPAELGIAAAIA